MLYCDVQIRSRIKTALHVISIERLGNIFHLFMTKCEPISKALGVKSMSIVYVESKTMN